MKTMKRKEVTFTEYNEIMDKITHQNLPIHEILIEMLEEASKYTSKYTIVDKKRRSTKNDTKSRRKAI